MTICKQYCHFFDLEFILQKCNEKEILVILNFSKTISVSKLYKFFVTFKKLEKPDIAIKI